jgi:hypothetical protein
MLELRDQWVGDPSSWVAMLAADRALGDTSQSRSPFASTASAIAVIARSVARTPGGLAQPT